MSLGLNEWSSKIIIDCYHVFVGNVMIALIWECLAFDIRYAFDSINHEFSLFQVGHFSSHKHMSTVWVTVETNKLRTGDTNMYKETVIKLSCVGLVRLHSFYFSGNGGRKKKRSFYTRRKHFIQSLRKTQ